MLEDGFHAVSECVDGRLVARIEKENTGCDQLTRGEARAFVLGADQLGDKVVTRTGAPVIHVIAQEGGKIGGCFAGAPLNVLVAAGLVHAYHGVRPVEEVVGHCFGHPEETRNGDDREWAYIGGQKVEWTLGKAVDECVAKLGNRRF